MKLEPGQRTYLVIGSPWLSAIAAMRSETASDDPWQVAGSFRPGDLLVTVLDTDPRAVLCLERLIDDGDPAGEDVVIGEQLMTMHLPAVPDVEARSGAAVPKRPGPIPARDADKLLDAIAAIDRDLSYQPRAALHGPLAEAWIRLNAQGVCLLCDTPVDPGDPATGTHVDLETEVGVDVDSLLCADCAEEMAHSPYASLTEHLFATRHPQCPRCAAFQTLTVAHGKAQLNPEFAPRFPWELATTDLLYGDETDWQCRACGHGWDLLTPEMLPDEVREQREVVPLWSRNEDNRIVIARKDRGRDSYEPASVLCAPLEPHDVMRTLATIVDTTFAGDWSAALDVIVDRSFSAWEVLDHAINEASETIGDRARDIRYSGDPTFVPVPGVGIRTDYGPFNRGTAIGVDFGSDDYYDVMYAFIIDDDGNADILDAQTITETIVDGRRMRGEILSWTFSHTLTPDDYRNPSAPKPSE